MPCATSAVCHKLLNCLGVYGKGVSSLCMCIVFDEHVCQFAGFQTCVGSLTISVFCGLKSGDQWAGWYAALQCALALGFT